MRRSGPCHATTSLDITSSHAESARADSASCPCLFAPTRRVRLLDRLTVEGVAGGQRAVLEPDGEPVHAGRGRAVGPLLGADLAVDRLLDGVVADGLGRRD